MIFIEQKIFNCLLTNACANSSKGNFCSTVGTRDDADAGTRDILRLTLLAESRFGLAVRR